MSTGHEPVILAEPLPPRSQAEAEIQQLPPSRVLTLVRPRGDSWYLGLILAATAVLLPALWNHLQLRGVESAWRVLISLTISTVVYWVIHRKDLMFSKYYYSSRGPSAGREVLFRGLFVLCLMGYIYLSPGWEYVAPRTADLISRAYNEISGRTAELKTMVEKSEWSLWGGIQQVMDFLWLPWVFFQSLLRDLVFVILCIFLGLFSTSVLILAYALDVRSALIASLVGLAITLTMFNALKHSAGSYMLGGALCLFFATLIKINYPTIWTNYDFSDLSPDTAHIVRRLLSLKNGKLEGLNEKSYKDEVRALIADDWADEHAVRGLCDRISADLISKGIAKSDSTGNLIEAVRLRKFGIWNVFLMGFCIVYWLNLGAGFLELIPDNVPIIGQIDEGVLAYVFWKQYERYAEDRRGG